MPQSPISKLTPPFSLVPFFWESFNLLVRIKKMVNRTLSLGLYLSRICYLLNFLNLYIPLWLRKFFKFMVFRLLKKAFASQQTKSRHFYSCPSPPGQSSLQSSYCYPDTQGDYSSPQAASVRKSLPPSRNRGEKTMKLSLTGFEADGRL